MLTFIFSVISIVLILYLYTNLNKGPLLLLFFYFIFPESAITIGSLQLTKNYILILCYIAFLLNYKYKHHQKISIIPFYPLLCYFGLFLLIIPLQNGLTYLSQFKYWLQDIILSLTVPIIIFNYNCYNCRNLRKTKDIFILIICIINIYGLFLTTIKGENPYIELFSVFYFDPDAITSLMRYYADPNRIFGRISSVFFHPMLYALFLGFSLIYVIYIKDSIKKNFFYFILSILTLNIFFCGVRTVIAALFITLVYYLFRIRKAKIILLTFILLFLIYNALSYIPGMSEYINSMNLKSQDNEVGGSSIEMRLFQLLGCIDEVKDAILQGNGYGWHKFYLDTEGDHPIIFNFESLIFIIICNSGIIGFFIWLIFIFKYKIYITKICKNRTNKIIFECLLIYYLSYSCITGEYNYMGIFMVLYSIMISEMIQYNKNKENSMTHYDKNYI